MLINYIRSCFCKHDWQYLKEIKTYDYGDSGVNSYPIKVRRVYVCQKCLAVKRIKL